MQSNISRTIVIHFLFQVRKGNMIQFPHCKYTGKHSCSQLTFCRHIHTHKCKQTCTYTILIKILNMTLAMQIISYHKNYGYLMAFTVYFYRIYIKLVTYKYNLYLNHLACLAHRGEQSALD